MKRRDVAWYDYKDDGPFDHYGRIWKIVEGKVYFIESTGRLIIDEPSRFTVVKYNGRLQWSHRRQCWDFLEMPSLRKLKTHPNYRTFYKEK